MKNLGEKGVLAYPGTAEIFGVPPVISGTGEAMNFKFCTHIYRIDQSKTPLKFLALVAVGILRDSEKFSRHLYIGRITRSSLR